MAEAIQKAGTDPVELEKVYKQYEDEIKSLTTKAEQFEDVEKKGIFQELKKTKEELENIRKTKQQEEEDVAKKKGEFEELANKYKSERDEFESKFKDTSKVAEKWTNYEKTRRETLLGKLTDEKVKKIAEQLPTLETLEEFVDLHLDSKPDDGSSNQRHKKKDVEEKKPLFDYSKSNMPN